MQIQFQQRANSLYSGDLITCLFVSFKRHANTMQMLEKLTPGCRFESVRQWRPAHLAKIPPPASLKPHEMKRKIHRSNLFHSSAYNSSNSISRSICALGTRGVQIAECRVGFFFLCNFHRCQQGGFKHRRKGIKFRLTFKGRSQWGDGN